MFLSLPSNIFCATNNHMDHLSTSNSINDYLYIDTFDTECSSSEIKCLVVNPKEVERLKTVVDDKHMELMIFTSTNNDLTTDDYSSFLFSCSAFEYFLKLIPEEIMNSSDFGFLHSHKYIDLELLGTLYLNGKMYLDFKSCEDSKQTNNEFDQNKIKGLTTGQIESFFNKERNADQLVVEGIDYQIRRLEIKLEKLNILERAVSSDGTYKLPERRYINQEIDRLRKEKETILRIERSKTLEMARQPQIRSTLIPAIQQTFLQKLRNNKLAEHTNVNRIMPDKQKIVYRITETTPKIQSQPQQQRVNTPVLFRRTPSYERHHHQPQSVNTPVLARRTPSYERLHQHHYGSCENVFFDENPRQPIFHQTRHGSMNSLNLQHPSSPTPASILMSGRNSPVQRHFSFSQGNNQQPYGGMYRHGSTQSVRHFSYQ